MKASRDCVIYKRDTAPTQTNNKDIAIVDEIVKSLWT